VRRAGVERNAHLPTCLAINMTIDRRQLLTGVGAGLAACQAPLRLAPPTPTLDAVFEANARVLPERAGANHYPMAAEALEALGCAEHIEPSWRSAASGYAGDVSSNEPLERPERALGQYERYGDWLAFFRAQLQRAPWRDVVGKWIPRLTPGLIGGAFHGLIRTGHAVRALRTANSQPRQDELAAALAYWAARYVELPTTTEHATLDLHRISSPGRRDDTPLSFFKVTEVVTQNSFAPPLNRLDGRDAHADLTALARECAAGVLEMLVQERHRLWLMHSVTAPGSAQLLLPELAPSDARRLAAHVRQAVLAWYAALGSDFIPREHERASLPDWSPLLARAATSGSVHTIKLMEALQRFDTDDDPLWRSVAVQWFEWT